MLEPLPIRPQPDANQIVSVDLLAASERSDSFPQDWGREKRETAFGRYVKWLQLKMRHPKVRLAPTRDIDEFWHLHMLSPVAYYRDCMRAFGYVLDHDGGFGKAPDELPLLQNVFTNTAILWETAYGEPYREDGLLVEEAATKCWHDCQSRCWHACADIQ